jgi:hypothetical protein
MHYERKKMETPLTIRYSPQKDDYIQASRALALKSPLFLILASVVLLAMAASAVILVLNPAGTSTLQSASGIVLLVGAFYLVYYFVLIPFQLTKAYKTTDYLREEREFSFTSEQVKMKIGEDEIEFAWENFKNVIDGRRLFVMVYRAD